MVENELITKVRTRNVKSILSNVFTASLTLANGNGTTANGSAVDLGGSMSGNISITDATQTYNFKVGLGIGSNPAQILFAAKDYAFIGRQALQYLEFNNGNTVLTLGSDASGDVYHRNASGYLTRRGVLTATSTATLTVNSDTTYQSCITAQAEALTIANPTGTPFNGQDLIVRVKDNGTARAITFGAQFRAIGTALPTTTTISKTLYICSLWNAADSKWDTVNHLEV